MPDVSKITYSGQEYTIKDTIARSSINNKADISSPAFNGTPTAPTASAGTNNTQIATTEFVMNAVSNGGGGGSSTDTKNTAGATDTSSKLYLIGAETQSENPQTYSHDTAYVGTNGHLYSANVECLYGTYSSTAPSSPVVGQIWLKDVGMTIEESKVLVVNTGTISSLPVTITDSNITSDMIVINPTTAVTVSSAQGSDFTVTTYDGDLTISGTLNSATNITLYLMRSR